MQLIIKKEYAKEIHDLYEAGYKFESKTVYFAFIWCIDNGHYDIARHIFVHNEIPKRDVILYAQDLCVEDDIQGVKFLDNLITDYGVFEGFDEEYQYICDFLENI